MAPRLSSSIIRTAAMSASAGFATRSRDNGSDAGLPARARSLSSFPDVALGVSRCAIRSRFMFWAFGPEAPARRPRARLPWITGAGLPVDSDERPQQDGRGHHGYGDDAPDMAA